MPLTLRVTTIAQGDQQCFMGVFRVSAEEADKAQVFLTAAGQILISDRLFEDFLGYSCQVRLVLSSIVLGLCRTAGQKIEHPRAM